MKKLLYLTYLTLITLCMGCQSESLDIRANYRIKLQVVSPTKDEQLRAQSTYWLQLELLTDSYYSDQGYQLQFYQQTGLGRLVKGDPRGEIKETVLQKVPIALPLGLSDWQYTPEAAGSNELVLIAQQERGYTQPDTIRLKFNIHP